MTKNAAPHAMRSGLWAATLLFFFLLGVRSAAMADSPELEFHAPATPEDPTTPAVMRDLAERLLPVYEDSDPDRYLANLSALQMVAGDYAAADVSRQTLRDRRRQTNAGRAVGHGIIYDLYAYAKTIESENRLPFAEAFTRSFDDVIHPLSDRDAYLVTRWLASSPQVFRDAFQNALDQQRAKDSVDQAEAVKLFWAYIAFSAYRSFATLVDSLKAEDDGRRYAIDDVLIKTGKGKNVPAVVIRPKNPPKPLPTLLEITIGDIQDSAMDCAAHGYVGVVAYSRAKATGAHRVAPYEHDGDDARAVINWIAKQPWSDGRVGMYGDGYSAFTSWAAAARLPGALKAIATSAPTAPGINAPMAGSIFQNSAYRWSLYMYSAKPRVEESYEDDAPWRALDQKWYRSGRRYRDLGRLHGQPDPIFIRWLNHPSYDPFWQKMIPFQEQFAHINIPVLTTTGYFGASEPGALYYFRQHYRYNPQANHTLLIGPYEDDVMQRGPAALLHSYQVDAVALVDLHELQYLWFDHIFKGTATPTLLSNRVNYEVMGANEWRHAASLEAMGGDSLRYYLDTAAPSDRRRLVRHKPAKPAFLLQSVRFVDRSDAGWMPPTELVTRGVVTHNDLTFVSEPFAKPTEISGLFSALLDFTVNKMDVDLNIMLYERLASGDYIRLFNPVYEFRASYAQDRVSRHLLKAGERQQLSFTSERMTSRQLQAGSRLVMVLGVNKRPDREINYGTGNDVSEESIVEARPALKIRWYNDSYIDIPVRKHD